MNYLTALNMSRSYYIREVLLNVKMQIVACEHPSPT